LYNPDNSKIVISRDVVFDEEGEWDFGTHKKEYSFFPEFEEEASKEVQQVPSSPTSPASEDTGSERIVTRTRSLQDLYDNTEALSPRRLEDFYEETRGMDNITLFCLFAYCEPMNFEEAAQDNRRIQGCQNRTGHRTGELNGSRFNGRTGVEPRSDRFSLNI
jgi:hypothetical protein